MTTRERARERTRRSVLASAERCFRAEGYEATTIRRIAEGAEVSVGSVMAVGDKQSLLVQVFDRAIEALHRGSSPAPTREPAAPQPHPQRLADELVALVLPFIELFATDAKLSRRYASILVSGEYRSEVFGGLASDLTTEFCRLLVRAGAPASEAEARARALHAAYLGVLFTASGRGGHGPVGAQAEEAETPQALSAQLRSELHRIFTVLAPLDREDEPDREDERESA